MTEDDDTSQLSDPTANRQPSEFLDRLREAVRNSGGPSAVARLSGVPLSTLNTYLSGKPPKLASIVAVASACKISIDWLVSGDVPAKSQSKYRNAEDQTLLSPPPANDIDLPSLEKAMMVVDLVVTTAGRDYTVRQRAVMLRNAYRELTTPEADLPPLPHFTPRAQ